MSTLFTPITLRGLTIQNRIVVSPMCQYSAKEGCATDWHLMHLGNLAISGAGLIILEATAVNPIGRITPYDLGLYSAENEEALRKVIEFCHIKSKAAFGIQLSHAGRKGSSQVPWEGGGPLDSEKKWQTVAPSSIARDSVSLVPHELSIREIEDLKKDFVEAARRAARIGIDLIELHCAHGYLLHEFLSPISNQRNDLYGGSYENRMRLPLEIAEAIRSEWPKEKPMGARITGTDWLPLGLEVSDAVIFAERLKLLGFDYVCVSSGGIIPKTNIEIGPEYQVSLAEDVRKNTGMTTQAVGLITSGKQAEEIITSGKADMVAFARAFIDDPRFAWHAALDLGVNIEYPPQYLRGKGAVWPRE